MDTSTAWFRSATSMSAPRQEKAHDATDKSNSHQSDERLLFNGSGCGRRRFSDLISDLTVDMVRGRGRLARQFLHPGPCIAGKTTDSSLYVSGHARGPVFDIGPIH